LWQAICSLLLAVKAGITHVVGYGLLSCAQIVRFLVELPTNRLKFGGKFKTDRDSGQAKAPLRLDAKFLSAMPICAYQQASRSGSAWSTQLRKSASLSAGDAP
jgi:hypothetical protein